MAKILEGKTLAKEILLSLEVRVAEVKKRIGRTPSLTIINYFPDSAAAVYVKRKMAACEKLGISARLLMPERKDDYKGFIAELGRLGADADVDAIMVERPLPPGFETAETWTALCPEKDVDGLSIVNAGRLFLSKKIGDIENGGFFSPCTALAVVRLLRSHNIGLSGKRVAVVGRSSVVGRPLAHMLTSLDATVTVCHTRTENVEEVFNRSDIVISAAGKARWITKDMIRPGTIVVDVGTNLDESGKLCGDVDYERVAERCDAITPVPGGVGPVTLACLIENVVKAAESSRPKEKKEIILT